MKNLFKKYNKYFIPLLSLIIVPIIYSIAYICKLGLAFRNNVPISLITISINDVVFVFTFIVMLLLMICSILLIFKPLIEKYIKKIKILLFFICSSYIFVTFLESTEVINKRLNIFIILNFFCIIFICTLKNRKTDFILFYLKISIINFILILSMLFIFSDIGKLVLFHHYSSYYIMSDSLKNNKYEILLENSENYILKDVNSKNFNNYIVFNKSNTFYVVK